MKRIARVLCLVIPLAVLAFALSQLIPILMDYRQSDQAYDQLAKTYVTETNTEAEDNAHATWWADAVQVDFSALQQVNPDIIGWIRFDNFDDVAVDYPILYSGDNETYLRTNFAGERFQAGSVFLEGLNDPEMTESYQIIYGHNMKDGSMFGTLKKYRTQDEFLKDHAFFTVYTPKGAYRYQIFSYHEVLATDEVYSVGYTPGDQYTQFLNHLKEQSMEPVDLELPEDAKVVTLSTCTSSGEEKRFVLHGVCIDSAIQ